MAESRRNWPRANVCYEGLKAEIGPNEDQTAFLYYHGGRNELVKVDEGGVQYPHGR